MARYCKVCGLRATSLFCSPDCADTGRWIDEAHARGPTPAKSMAWPEPEPVECVDPGIVCIAGLVLPVGELAVLARRRAGL